MRVARVAALEALETERRRGVLAPLLADGVNDPLIGEEDAPILSSLLWPAAQKLAEITNLWVCECPRLVPAEVDAIVPLGDC